MKPLGTSDPTSVASYQLLAVLGGGGMGRVYLAQSRTGRRVAIKVVRPELAENPDFRRRFAREVAAARAVNPLYTAAVVDADTEAEAPWLATVFIDGPSLEKRVAEQGALTSPAMLTLAACLAEALASIHRSGLVHRDLKPSNVLLTDAGPHIVDFGIALAPDTRTTTDLLMGTPSYMAPERLQGVEGSPAGDIFALGATLYFAATGKTLVNGATAYIKIMQVAEGRFDLSPAPKELRPLITRCVSRRPKDRPTADELAATLTASGAPAPRPGWYRSSPGVPLAPFADSMLPRVKIKQLPTAGWSRRRLLTVGGVVAVAVAGGVAATSFGRQPGGTPPPRPGRLLWQARSGASDLPPDDDTSSRIIVDPRGILIAAAGSDLVAVDLHGSGVWTKTLSPQRLHLRRWGDAVLANDPTRLWLLDAASGEQIFTVAAADAVRAVSPKTTPDPSAHQVGRIELTPQRAFVGVGPFVIAVSRGGQPLGQYLRPATRQGLLAASRHPLAASADWLLTQEISGSLAQVSLFDVSSAAHRWSFSYRFDPNAKPDPGDRPPPDGSGGGPGGGPPDGRPDPPFEQVWQRSEAHFAPDHVLVRDIRDVRVLRLSDGSQLWTTPSPKPVAAAALMDDTILVAADHLRAYALTSGAFQWQADLRGARLALPATVEAAGAAAGPTTAPRASRGSGASGAPNASAAPIASGGPATASTTGTAAPAVADIIAASDTSICGLDRQGLIKWQGNMPGDVDELTIDGGVAFVTFKPDRPASNVDAAAFAIT